MLENFCSSPIFGRLKVASYLVDLVKGQDTEPERPEKLDPDPDKTIPDPQIHNIVGRLDESDTVTHSLKNLQR